MEDSSSSKKCTEEMVTSFGPLKPFMYRGLPPRPQEPSAAPTPQEVAEEKEMRRVQALAEKEIHRTAKLEAKRQEDDGFMFKFQKFFSDVSMKVKKQSSTTVAKTNISAMEMQHKKSFQRWLRYFPEFTSTSIYNSLKEVMAKRKEEARNAAQNSATAQQTSTANENDGETIFEDFQDPNHEILISDFKCDALNGDETIEGHAFVTNHNLCFSSRKERIREVIPYSEIASMQKSVTLKTDKKGVPYVICIPAENVLFDAIQVFTTTCRVYRFFNFSTAPLSVETSEKKGETATPSQLAVSNFYNSFDRALRRDQVIPVPSLRYSNRKFGYDGECERVNEDEKEDQYD